MDRLKDRPSHLAAYEHIRQDAGEHFDNLAEHGYIQRLAQIDQAAVSLMWGASIGIDALVLAYHYPLEADDMEEGYADTLLQTRVMIVETPPCHDKQNAARWCGVSVRQIERWMKGIPGKGMAPLRHIKHGRERFFLELDLWNHMAKHGVGQRIRHVNEYAEGDVLPGFETDGDE